MRLPSPLRSLGATSVAVLSLVVAGTGCSNALDPATANLSGTVAGINATTSTIAVNTGVMCIAIVAPCYDYSVHLVGKVYEETEPGKFAPISLDRVSIGAAVLVWTDGVVLESHPGQVTATRVVVRFGSGFGTRKVRSLH